jgi:hypothetical protein
VCDLVGEERALMMRWWLSLQPSRFDRATTFFRWEVDQGASPGNSRRLGQSMMAARVSGPLSSRKRRGMQAGRGDKLW